MFPWSKSKNFFGFGVLSSSTVRICNKNFLARFSKSQGYSLTDLADLAKNLTSPFYGPIRRKTLSGVFLRKRNFDSSSTSRDIRI